MKIINYPFQQAVLKNTTKILIDTCFLLSLLYDKDPKNPECIMTLKKLKLANCMLFTNDIITAEFINQIQKKLFLDDIKYRILHTEPVNTPSNVELILACFSKNDRKLIKERKLEKFHHIPFNKYFYNISKNEWKKDLLKVYFDKSVDSHSEIEKSLNLSHVSIDSSSVALAKDLMKKYMLSVNDAYHLACAELNNIEYLLTLDCDFEEISKIKVNILKI